MRYPPGTLLFIGRLGAPAWANDHSTKDAVFELNEGDPIVVIAQNPTLEGEALCLTPYGLLYVHVEDIELSTKSE